jgi:hypothetical protein
LVDFSPYFYSFWGGMVGFRAAEIWVYIEFIAARLPTLQIKCEKKVIPYLKFNTPAKSPHDRKGYSNLPLFYRTQYRWAPFFQFYDFF